MNSTKLDQDEKKAQEVGTVQHSARKRRAKEAKQIEKDFATVSTSYSVRGNKIIRLERLANGNVNKSFAGTKKSNPKLFKKIQSGK